MELIFLGTSSGTPTKTRNVSALALTESRGKNWFLVDCGEGAQHQLLRTKLSLNSLKGIFITHIHGDHCYGLPGLLGSASMNGRTKPLNIIAPKGIKAWLEATQIHTQNHLSFELIFTDSERLSAFALGQFSVDSTPLAHPVPSFAYGFTEVKLELNLDLEKLKSLGIPQGPLWGKLKSGADIEYFGETLSSSEFVRQVHKPRKVLICGDNSRPNLLKDACKDTHVLVHEATYAKNLAGKAANFGHSYAELVARFAEENSIPNLLLTHFSSRYQLAPAADSSIEQIRIEAENKYSGNLYLAEDFQTYKLEKSGDFSFSDF